MTGFEIRGATTDDLGQMGQLWRASFNAPQHVLDSIRERTRVHRVLAATDGGLLIATAQGFGLRQWFGGRPVSTVGIASVATLPRYRGTGVGSAIMGAALAKARDEGHSLATLYPATVPVYRRLGFEYAGTYTKYRVRIGALPSGPARDLIDMPEDGGPARASYVRLAARENGLTEGMDDDWWPWRVLGRYVPDPGGAVMTAEEIPDGYAAYRQENLENEWGYRVACSHLVAHTREAALTLLSYFRRFKGVGMEIEWQGPPVEPLALLLPEQSFEVPWVFRNMSRILDVAGAFESRGYPDDVSGSVAFAVADPMFEENSGTFVLEAENGKVRVARDGPETRSAGEPLTIGALTSIFTGYVTPSDACALGLMPADHPAGPLFARLFVGSSPWTPDFF
jgi:predicted acetyltransferase